MKKSLLLLFFAVTALLGFAMSTKNLTVDAAAAGQVVFHYQKWDGVYDSVGLWVWGTGTDGSSNGLEKTSVDDFGAVIEIAIGADATTAGIIPISAEIGNDNRWSNKDSKGDADLSLDVTAAAAGATMHVYFFSGSDTIFVASEEYINVFVVYFTASEVYEENLGLHAWGGWYNDANIGSWGVWGTPTPIFTGEFTTPEGKLGKVGMAQAIVDGGTPNLIIYAGNDATKKTGDVAIDVTGLVAGDCTALYAAAEQWQGFDNVTLFADSSFAFKFTPYSMIEGKLDGTYALTKSIIQVKFSAEVASAYEDITQPIVTTYELYEIVGYEYIPTGSGGITIDDTVYDPYVASDIPSNVAGRVVFHYQKWDSDYSDVGLWTWGTGTDGTGAPVIRSGVDDFGAVMVINVDDDASDTIGLIPIADSIGTDDRWTYRETPDGQHINFDVTAIKNGTVDEIHVYYFQGGFQTYFVADPAKANIITLYYESDGTYEANLGIYTWGSWTNQEGDWGQSIPMTESFKSPDDVPGVAVMNSFDPAVEEDWIGYLVYAGDDPSKKTGDVNNGTGAGFGTMVAGDVLVVYTGFSDKTWSPDHDRFVLELMVETEKVAIYDYVEYEETSYERALYDVAAMFTLLKDGVAVENAIKSVSFNEDKDVITELAVELNVELESGHEYVLQFDNGAEGLDNRAAEVDVVTDAEGPVITVLLTEELTFVAGTAWDTSYWPNIRAIDDRDGNVSDRIYVKPEEGIVNMNKAGVYPITVTAYDDWGNETQATFNITITAPETGCAAQNASIGILGLFGVAFFFARRKEWF